MNDDEDASGGHRSIERAVAIARDERRRALCRYLAATAGSDVSVATLVDSLHRETETDRERLEVELAHVHLPMLADEGVLEYDRRRGTVRIDRNRLTALCRTLESVLADVDCTKTGADRSTGVD